MDRLPPLRIQRWSTADVPITQRLDYYADALTVAVDPMRVASGNPESFNADIESVEVGPLTLIRANAGQHVCIRQAQDITQGGGRHFHLIMNVTSAWTLIHRGSVGLRADDAVLLDSQFPHQINLLTFQIVHIKIEAEWLKRWIPLPAIMAGRVIHHDSRWGRPLCAFVSRLSPQFAVASPLPPMVIADHIGALLALIASEITHGGLPVRPAEKALSTRVLDSIVQRCCNPQLTAADVATDLNVSTRTLHRALFACGHSFGASLLQARVDFANRMLESPLFKRITTTEVGRRAGFSDPSHFSRVFRRLTGFTPSQVRRAVPTASDDEA